MKNQQAAVELSDVSPARIFARPTADDLWLGPTQESALRQLSAGVPVRVLLGPSSSGRSCLLRHLAKRANKEFLSLTARGPQRLRSALLKALMGSAGLPCDRLVRDEMRSLLAVFIREQLARGRRVVLQIDDADKLGPAAFGELLRLWRVARTADAAPELLLCLVHLDHGSSAAADFVRSTPAPAVTVLSWLNSTEISWYIHWRMQRFELMDMFSEAAIRLIGQCTHGCYLAIDHICQMTLLLLRNRECERADVLLVREAMRTLSRQKRSREADAAAEAQAELFVTRDGALLHQVALGDRLVIGRSPLNDIALDSAFVSRHHLAITRGATGYYVSDMNSVNGVLLNGQRVKSAPLGNGDLIGIGNYRLKFIVTGEVLRFAEDDPDGLLTETSVMPTPEIPEPAYLKVIK